MKWKNHVKWQAHAETVELRDIICIAQNSKMCANI